MNSDTTALTLGAVEAANVDRLVGLNYVEPQPERRSRWTARLAKTWGGGERQEWHPGSPICRGCGVAIDPGPIVAEIAQNRISWPITVCDDCMDLVREHYDGTQRPANVTLTPQWDEQCPPLLKEAITGQLPAVIDRAAYNRVVAWRPTAGGKGLFVLGPSGTGKTTALWALARELEREGCAPLILTGVELGRQLSQAARDISSVEHLWRCRVLMIDDLGKEKSTPAMAALFWEVLDKRYLHQRPLVFTSRFDGDAMRVRFGEECLGDDIRRRINELCRGVRFTIAAPSGKISDP